MTVEQTNVIDFIGINADGEVVLTVSDHLDWDQVNEHLFCLQEKLNAYLRFTESGEIFDSYPKASGCPIVMNVVLKYAAPNNASWFFERASGAITEAGFKFTLSQPPVQAS